MTSCLFPIIEIETTRKLLKSAGSGKVWQKRLYYLVRAAAIRKPVRDAHNNTQ